MRKFSAVTLIAVALAACGDGPTDPPPAGTGITLVVSPGALLLPEAGGTQRLQAHAIDADGDSTLVDAAFQSSDPSVVSIGADDVATGGATLGSAQIVATSGDLTSAPILVLRATPAAGALLVADSQVVGAIAPVDPAAAYAPGWQYRVRLRGVTPAVGQVVLASGGAPIGGRAVSIGAAGGDVDVVLALLTIDEMFDQLVVDERLSLQNAELGVPDALRGSFEVRRGARGAVRLTPRTRQRAFTASASRPSLSATAIEREFDLGPFECKAEVPPGFTFPLSLDVFSMEMHQTLDLDLVIADASLQRLVIQGGIAPRLTASPRLTAALEAKAECKLQLATLILPVGGPLAPIIGGQVPLGVGFEIGAKASFGDLGIDAFLESSISAEFGIDCASGCRIVTEIGGTPPGGFFKPVLPALGADVRFELGASAFGWGELTIGNPFIQALRFKAVELKAGLEQKFELAAPEVQAADAAYASSYSLKPVIEAKAGSSLVPLANLLRINLATLTFAPELPTLAQSARGTFAITPASVAPGDGTALGDMATFTITLTDVTYLGAYAVESVEIRWRRMIGESVTLESGRPGCTDLAAAQDQLTFTCQTDFLEEHEGEQTFYAFVKTRIFGVPVPVPLEIAIDAHSTTRVTQAAALEWSFDSDLDGWSAADAGDEHDSAHWTTDVGTPPGSVRLDGSDFLTPDGVPNAWLFRTVQLPTDATALTFDTRAQAVGQDGALRVRVIPAGGPSQILLDWEVLGGEQWTSRSADVSALAGQTVTIYFEQSDNDLGVGEARFVDNVRVLVSGQGP